MNKQTIFVFLFIIVIAASAFWIMSPLSDASGGKAIAAETSGETEAPKKETVVNKASDGPAWAKRCNQSKLEDGDENKTERCEIWQRLVKTDTGARFAEIAIGYPSVDSNDARGVVVLPLDVLLEPGVRMQIDEGRVYEFSFRYCTAGQIKGCVAVIKLSPGIVDEMKKGTKASIQFISARGQTFTVPISLEGFTKAITELK